MVQNAAEYLTERTRKAIQYQAERVGVDYSVAESMYISIFNQFRSPDAAMKFSLPLLIKQLGQVARRT